MLSSYSLNLKRGLVFLFLALLIFLIPGCSGNSGFLSNLLEKPVAFTPYPPMPEQAVAISPVSGTAKDGYSLALGKGWNTISFPFNSVVSTSGFSREIQYYQDGQYHPINPSTAAPTIDCGKGYWAYQDNAATATINGGNGPAINSVTLSSGWNLIGLPYNAAKNFSDLTLTFNEQTKPLTEASTMDTEAGSQWLYGNIEYYKNSRWYTLRYDRSGSSALSPGIGYWMFSWKDGMTLNYVPPVRANEPWAKTWGTEDYEFGQAVATDSQGDIFCAGQGNGFAYLLKYDSTGSLLWQKGYGNNKFASGWAIAADSLGNVYLGGDTNIGSSRLAAFIVKYSPNGEILWERTWRPTDGWAKICSLVCDSQGNICGAGYTNGFEEDVLLLKYTPAGELAWAKSWGAADSSDTAYGLAADSSDNLFIAGSTYSAGAGDMDALLQKWDTNGNLLVCKTWGGSGMDYAWAVALDSGQNIYLTGYFGDSDCAMLLKYDSQLNLQWQKSWSTGDFCSGQAVKADASGNVYVGAADYLYSGASMCLLKYNASGDLQAQTSWHSDGLDDLINGMALDGAGNVFMSGYVPAAGSRWQPESGTSADISGSPTTSVIAAADATGSSNVISGFGVSVSGQETFAGGTDNVLVKYLATYTNPNPQGHLDGIAPSGGPVGTTVTLTGSNFGSKGAVYFGDFIAPVISWSAGRVICTAPQELPDGVAEVKLSCNDKFTNSLEFAVTIPQLSGILPAQGQVGSTVTVSGANLGSDGTLSIGGIAAENISWSDNQIVAIVPLLGTGGSLDVLAMVNDKTSNSLSFLVQFPQISSLNPTSATYLTPVTISGSYFGSSQGTVNFVGYSISLPAPIQSWSDNQIVCLVPQGTNYSAQVSVITGGLTTNSINFNLLTPSISSLSPYSGLVGTTLTINGSDFGSSGTAELAGTNLPILSWTASRVIARIPAGAASGGVKVIVNGQESYTVNFSVTQPAGVPIIGSLSPDTGGIGITVTISGSNFTTTPGLIYFAGHSAAVWSWTGNLIVSTVPAGTPSGPVTVVNAAGTSAGMDFTINAPVITGYSPTSGQAGDLVTIIGSDFDDIQGNSAVYFNGLAAGNAFSWSNGQIICRVPAGATTGYLYLIVKGQYAYGDNFTVVVPPPVTPPYFIRKWGGESPNEWPCDAVMAPGNYLYVVGGTESFGDNGAAFVLKYNSQGDLLWQKCWDYADQNPTAYSCCLDKAGNLYVTGGTSNSSPGTFLLKYNSSGELIWQKLVDNISPWDEAIACDEQNNLYMTGSWSVWISQFSTFECTMSLLKINPEGNIIWEQTWGTDGPVPHWGHYEPTLLLTNGIAVDPLRNSVYILGYHEKYDQTTFSYKSITFIMQFRTSCGNLGWSKGWVFPRSIEPIKMALGKDGNLYNLGSGYNLEDDECICLFKVSPNGSLVAGPKTWTHPGHAVSARNMTLDRAGNVHLIGSDDLYSERLLYLKYNSMLQLTDQRSFGWNDLTYTGDFASGLSLAVDSFLNPYLLGEIYGVGGWWRSEAGVSGTMSSTTGFPHIFRISPSDTLVDADGVDFAVEASGGGHVWLLKP